MDIDMSALRLLEREREIPLDLLIPTIEQALLVACRREPTAKTEAAETVARTEFTERIENFFEYDGLSYHELALYFLIRFPPGTAHLHTDAFDRIDAGVTFRFRWFPVRRQELETLTLFPTFLARGLTDLPQSAVHIVEREHPH